MQENFREFLERLRQAGEMVDIRQPVDIRHIATLVNQSDKALFFHDVIGYEVPVVSGIIRSREHAIMSMGCKTYGEIKAKLRQGIDRPIPPRYVEKAAHKQVVMAGEDVDLFKLPVPMSSIYGGGPMITAGIVIEREPLYYSAVAERFAARPFAAVARALGELHTAEKLWQDPRGRPCVRGAAHAARPPVRSA